MLVNDDRCLAAYLHQGFSYLGMLFVVALFGASLAIVTHLWSMQIQRGKEAELLFIGEEFRRAIVLYVERSPGGKKAYPRTLEDLIEDRRFPNPQRYLRRIYRDPFTAGTDWGFIRAPDGGLLAVHSKFDGKPIKRTGFKARYAQFSAATSYRDWKFGALDAENPATLAQASGTDTLATGTLLVQGGNPPAVQPGPQPPTVRTGQQPDPPDRRATCAAQYRADQQVCAVVGNRYGPKIKGNCEASAGLRQQSCLTPSTLSLVPLVVGP